MIIESSIQRCWSWPIARLINSSNADADGDGRASDSKYCGLGLNLVATLYAD